MTKQKDARGNEVTNTLDGNGKALSVTDPAGQSVGYTYDASNRVTKVETTYTQDGQSRVSKNEYTYEDDRISTVSHNTTDNDTCDVQYKFHYDALGRKTSVTVSNGSEGAPEQALSTNIYSADRKSRLERVDYGNGGKVSYTYDDFDRVTGVTHDDDTDPKFTYEYDAKGRAAVVTDTRDGSTIRNIYDLTDRPTESEQRDGDGNLKYRTLISYDIKNRVKSFTEATATETKKTEYTYDADDRVTEVKYNGSDSSKVSYTYDKLNRITSRTVTNGSTYSTAYTYVPGSSTYGANATTPLVAMITQGSGANAMNFAYTYDNRGNITSETRNGVTTTYEYDALGQLTRVNDPNDPTGSTFGTTWIYSYDRGGNILYKSAYVYTTGTVGTVVRSWAYGYDDPNWKDKLTSFDGHTITYDAIGNPLNDGEWTYEWQAGRQLKRMTNLTTGVVMEFTYNHAGIRTKKVKKENCVAVETTEYILNGKQVVGLVHTDHTTNTTDEMQFFYDAQGRVSMLKYGGALYSYVHNLQGDVVGIVNESGVFLVEYKYDAWGKPICEVSDQVGTLNPFLYREYQYDKEMGLFYLIKRVYSERLSRFLNIDLMIEGNPFVYCSNCPAIYADYRGEDYTVVLNIWECREGTGNGHYSMSIISDYEFGDAVPAPGGDSIDGKEIVISYGGDMGIGKIKISGLDQNNMPDYRYILGTLDERGYESLYWILTGSFLGEKDETNPQVFYVIDEEFKEYSIKDKHYCGSFVAKVLSMMEFKDKNQLLDKLISNLKKRPMYVNRKKFKQHYPGNTYIIDFMKSKKFKSFCYDEHEETD